MTREYKNNICKKPKLYVFAGVHESLITGNAYSARSLCELTGIAKTTLTSRIANKSVITNVELRLVHKRPRELSDMNSGLLRSDSMRLADQFIRRKQG